ncbi:MAG: hypothetical protein GF320_20275 [Armatimonadia bacterium]|nr:hypothetical protein [Armatimonadia bacterium]
MRHTLLSGIMVLMLCLTPAMAQDAVAADEGADDPADEVVAEPDTPQATDEMDVEMEGMEGMEGMDAMGLALLPMLMMMGAMGEGDLEMSMDGPEGMEEMMSMMGGQGGLNPLLLMALAEGDADMEEILPLLMMSGGGGDIDPLLLMMMMDGGGGDMEGMMFLHMLTRDRGGERTIALPTDDYILIIENGTLYKINWRTMELEGSINYQAGAGGGLGALLPLMMGMEGDAAEAAPQVDMGETQTGAPPPGEAAEDYIYVPSEEDAEEGANAQ